METKEVLTVSDVYEHAASIGKDIEVIVLEYGKETIEDIMPKIVYVLEQLETLAEKHEKNQERIASLTLEREKFMIHANRDQAIQRQLEEKLSYMETLVSKDKKELEQKFKTLKAENDYFMEELDKRDKEMVKERSNGALPGDLEVMMRMKETIDDQRNQLRVQRHELQAQKIDIEALQEQIARLGDINEHLRQRTSTDNNDITLDIGDQSKHAESHYDHKSRSPTNSDANTSLLDELKTQDSSFDEQDTGNSSFTELTASICLTSDESNIQLISSEEQPKKKDPNRPRYTLKEMQSLLEERNTYKIQMMALEEELQLYKESGEGAMKKRSDSVRTSELVPKQSGVRTFMQKFLGK